MHSRQQSVGYSSWCRDDVAGVPANGSIDVDIGGGNCALDADIEDTSAHRVVLELRKVVEDCVVAIGEVNVIPAWGPIV